MTQQRRADVRGRAWLGVAAAVVSVATACVASEPGAEADANVVTVFGPWRDDAAEHFRAAVAPFEELTGLDVVYSGSGSFSTDATARLRDGLEPDVVMFPQPGTMTELADDGYLVPITDAVRRTARESHRPAVHAAAEPLTGGAGVLYRLNVKSLVWYPPTLFEERGYSVPESFDELESLVAQIEADGSTPWCLGVESFSASGWPATDWVEDLVLRSGTTRQYDAWTRGDVPFTDPLVAGAAAELESLVLAPGMVAGGRRGVLNTPVPQAQLPMFETPVGCVLYRQASFAADALHGLYEIGPDGDTDVFVLPGRTSDPAPLLLGGTFAAAATDRPETWQLMEYLASPEGSRVWVEEGGFVSPHRSVSLDDYSDDFDRRVAELLSTAEEVRFDASDLMPPEVGSGSFLEAMLTLIGTGDVDGALEVAQSGWESRDDDAGRRGSRSP